MQHWGQKRLNRVLTDLDKRLDRAWVFLQQRQENGANSVEGAGAGPQLVADGNAPLNPFKVRYTRLSIQEHLGVFEDEPGAGAARKNGGSRKARRDAYNSEQRKREREALAASKATAVPKQQQEQEDLEDDNRLGLKGMLRKAVLTGGARRKGASPSSAASPSSSCPPSVCPDAPFPHKHEHALDLKSAYSETRRADGSAGEPEWTNHTATFKGCLDYIWYSRTLLRCVATRPLPTEEEALRYGGFPSPLWPSDHVALCARLRWSSPENPEA